MGFEKVQAEDTVVVTFQDSLAWNTPLLLEGVEKRGEAWRKSRGMSGIFIGSSSFLEIRQPDLPPWWQTNLIAPSIPPLVRGLDSRYLNQIFSSNI